MSCCGSAVCGKSCGRSYAGRIAYAILFFFFTIIGWVFREWAADIFDKWVPTIQECDDNSSGGTSCSGTVAVYRVSFGLVVFHILLSLIMIRVRTYGDFRVSLQDGWWSFKAFFLVGIILAAFWIPNSFFAVYGWFALIGAAFFLLCQVVLLIEFAYSLSSTWWNKYQDEENNLYYGLLWGILIICYGLSLVGTILMFVFYHGCDENIVFITFNFVFCLVLSALSCLPQVQEHNPQSGIAQAAIVTLYTTYLTYSALTSQPHEDCNPYIQNDGTYNAATIIGLIFALISIGYASFSVAAQIGYSSPEDNETALLPHEQLQQNTEDDDEPSDEEPVGYNFSIFHLIFVLGSFYLAMVLTNWQLFSVGHENGNAQVDTGVGPVWVKIATSWVSLLIYLWTMIAPCLFPDRDFGYGDYE